jgi:hypothetical protein
MIVNTKAILAAAVGIAVAAIAIFFVMGVGNLSPPSDIEDPDMVQTQLSDLQLELTNILVDPIDEENANVQVIFDVHNPNRSTALLETINYALSVGGYQMTTGDIGVSPEGFVAGQEDIFPIIGSSTITLRDTQIALRNNLVATSWDSMVEGTAQYQVDVFFAYRLTGSNFQTIYDERNFTLTYP